MVGVVDLGLQLVDAALVFDACLVVEDSLTGRSFAVDAGRVGGLPCVDGSRANPFGTEVKDVELAVWCGEEAGQVAHAFGVAQHCDVAVIGNRPVLTIPAQDVGLLNGEAACRVRAARTFSNRSSSRPPGPSTIADHAADAIGLLDYLGVDRAHVVGHSSGAAIALEVAAADPSRVASLSLLEPPYLSGVAGAAFTELMAPIVKRHQTGDTAGAVADFYGLIGHPDWRATIERTVPGGVAQAEKNATTSFEIELPAVVAWSYGPDRAAAITCPVLSVLGTATAPLFVDSRQLLHQWLPQCVDADIPGATHLLQMESPAAVAAAIGRFLG